MGRLRRQWTRWRLRGDRLECPVCGARFDRFIEIAGRPDAACPRCNLYERHRALWLYLRDRTDVFTRRLRMLHLAPEPALERRLRALPNLEYTSADLDDALADVRFDVTRIPYPDESFDAIICSHVLEHVAEDVRAMRELRRVLAGGGWAIVLVPVDPDLASTQEDPAATTPAQRLAAYGQADHVRRYGRDFPDRLRAAGFAVEVDTYVRELPPEVISRHALRGHLMYLCRPASR